MIKYWNQWEKPSHISGNTDEELKDSFRVLKCETVALFCSLWLKSSKCNGTSSCLWIIMYYHCIILCVVLTKLYLSTKVRSILKLCHWLLKMNWLPVHSLLDNLLRSLFPLRTWHNVFPHVDQNKWKLTLFLRGLEVLFVATGIK